MQDARIKRAECRELLAKGIDPQDHREQQQQAELLTTYETVAWSWFEYRKSKRNFSEGYQKDVESLIRRNLLPHFGHLPISQITAPMALKAFKQYQDEKLKRTIQKHNEIMTYALHA